MQTFTITLLLCVATAFAYGNVEVRPAETTARNILENSVHGDNNQFHGGYVSTGIPTSQAPTTGPVATGCLSQSVDVNGNKVPHTETTPLPFNLHQTQPQQFPAHSHRYNGFSTAYPFPMQHQIPFQSFGPHPPQPFWANRFPYQQMAFQPFGAQPIHPFWANRFAYHPMAFQSFAPQSTWFNRFNGFDMHRPMPYMMPPFQRFGLPQSNPMHPMVIVKMLQPIILPIVQKENRKNTPKGEIEIDTERITSSGLGFRRSSQGFNRFGQNNNNFGQGFNRFTQGSNGFGQGFNRFGQLNNLEQSQTTFGPGMNRAGQSFNRFGQQYNNFGQRTNRFEKLRSSAPASFRQNTFGPFRMNEDENMHITVKLN